MLLQKKIANWSCNRRNGCYVKICKCNCFKHMHTDSSETESSEEDIPGSFYDFEDVNEVELEVEFNEKSPVYSSGSESEW